MGKSRKIWWKYVIKEQQVETKTKRTPKTETRSATQKERKMEAPKDEQEPDQDNKNKGQNPNPKRSVSREWKSKTIKEREREEESEGIRRYLILTPLCCFSLELLVLQIMENKKGKWVALKHKQLSQQLRKNERGREREAQLSRRGLEAKSEMYLIAKTKLN